jgi:chaperonin GroES
VLQVLFSKFGFAFTELEVGGDEYLLMKEQDIIGIMPKANAIADDIPELKPLSDRVLVRIDEVGEISSGGVLLPEAAREKPVSGKVVSTGPGKREEDGSITPMSVKAGDTVVYFKYAGDNMETTDGSKYVVLHQQDILCKA